MESSLENHKNTENPSLDILQNTFGFSVFRGLQEEVVNTVMQGKDALVLMPTGGGKSLCYQVPALCRLGMGVIISPLIAVMNDQVESLKQLGIKAAALHSELDLNEKIYLWDQLKSGSIDIIYISPERLLTPSFLDFLRSRTLSLIAIDEAHCVSAWGHEFRPEYRELSKLKEYFPHVPRIALTATADFRTRDDIISVLGMDKAEIFVDSFHRKNLFLHAQPKQSEMQQVLSALKQYRGEGAAIIYCGSRLKTERVSNRLQNKNIVAFAFHAGLSPIEKKSLLLRFRSGEPIVIVATIAFGMGIDRPDVRTVIHLDMPSSPEAYYQQIGRAGRDGEISHTLLLYGGETIARARYWLDKSQAPEREIRITKERLESMIAFTETTSCRTRSILEFLGESLEKPCGHCDNCCHPPITFDGIEAAQKVLSTVYRTGERFGALALVSVLCGSMTETVKRHALHSLSVFGIGSDHSEKWWRMIVRQLIARGAIRLYGEHGALGLDRNIARPLLRGDVALPLREDISLKSISGLSKDISDNKTKENLSKDENKRFLRLKEWRLGEAREQEIPPYVIFHDSVLSEIARNFPQSKNELSNIKGVGQSKLERYGDMVLLILLNKE